MKKFLLTLAVMVIAAGSVTAQDKVVKSDKAPITKAQLVAQPKHECKDHKDGQPCTKPADQQCPDCKEKAAAAKKCEKAEGMKECKKAEGMKECKIGEGKKHECKEGMKKCDKPEGMKECKKAEGKKHECKEGMKKCDKPEGMKECKKAEGMKHECKEGKKCDKPADQQCPDCKEAAKKN